jgi:predicted DsbA family dithiol-disulfide isomerase
MREGRVVAGAFAVLSLALGGFSCDKKSVARPPDPGPSVPFDETPGAAASPAPATAAAPPPDVGTPAVPSAKLEALAEKLPSPCGKPESLRRTLEADPGCRSAPFARRFVEKLIRLDVPDDELAELYRNRFGPRDNPQFTLRETPFAGSPNAPVTIVEFYDYACPHCREAAPILEKVVADHPRDVALYFKQYPLHKESMDASRAALAAHRQGKFKEMHRRLFAKGGRLSREELVAAARELGLDVARFEKDLLDPALTARIQADQEEARRAKLQGTPTIYLNGRVFMDNLSAEAISDWVEEELALAQ